MTNDTEYTPPTVWEFDPENGGNFSDINRPFAGSRFDQELPVGEHRFQLYSLATPNGVKVTTMFEELLEAGHDAEYDAWLIRIDEGEQFGSDFVDINPNSKIPALLDRGPDSPQRVFESGSILLYLAEEYGAFLPKDRAARTETLNWLFWQVGAGPYLGGGFGHFYNYAPKKLKYPIDRYATEAKRQLDLLDKRLAETEFIAGDEYTIADMAIWPWYGSMALGRMYDSAEFLAVNEYENLLRWAKHLEERPGVRRGRMVNRAWGEESERLRERHSAADFDKLGD